jgi:hypothetical protein
LGINRYRDILWFNKEAYVELLDWLLLVSFVQNGDTSKVGKKRFCETITFCSKLIKALRRAEKGSEYQIEKLMDFLKK